MDRVNIAAWTPPSLYHYPPYVSINRIENGVEVITRDENSVNTTVVMTDADWNALRKKIIDFGEV